MSWYVQVGICCSYSIATVARSVGTIPHIDMWFGLFGTLGWAYVGYPHGTTELLLVLNAIFSNIVGIRTNELLFWCVNPLKSLAFFMQIMVDRILYDAIIYIIRRENKWQQ